MSTRLTWSWSLVLTLGFHAATASAADYFVSPNGDDGAGGKSISAAWRSLSKANAALQPGDTVYLRGGKYLNDPIRPARSGNATAPIKYVAYEGEIPVLTSGKVRGLDIAIDLSGRSHIHIDGIEVDGVKRNPDARVNHFVQIDNGSYNVIANCVFQYAHGWTGIQLDEGAHHNKLLNNRIDIVGIYDNGKGQDWGNTIQINNAHHNLVEGNVISRGAHNLLEVTGEYNVFRNNVFDNDWSDVLGSGKGGRNVELIGRYNLFEGNVVRSAGASTDKPSNAGKKAEGVGNIVRRNYIFGNSNEGITSQSRASQKLVRGTHIFHNTIHGNGGPAWGLIFYDGGTEISNNVFKNNIVFNNRRDSGNDDADLVFKLAANPAGLVGNSLIESNLMAKLSADDVYVHVQNGGGRQRLSEAQSKYSKNFVANIQDTPSFVSANPRSAEDFALTPRSRGVDEAAPLTVTTSSGSGTVIEVKDAGYFTDGFSLIDGDRIQVGSGPALKVEKVDYSANRITVSQTIEWEAGAPVSLEYHGAGPDIGAHELGLGEVVRRLPRAPEPFSITVR